MKRTIFLFFLLVSSCRPADNERFDCSCLTSISIGNGLSFHPAESLLLTSAPTGLKDKNGKTLYRIFSYTYQDGVWTDKKEVPFSSRHTDYHPVFSPDGTSVFFNSTRPVPGSDTASAKVNIWEVAYKNGQWGEAEYLEGINTTEHDSYPSTAKNGRLYFNSSRPGGRGEMDFYATSFRDGQWSPPKPLTPLNTEHSENDLVVHPQEKFIIFNRYHMTEKTLDLWISFRENGEWQPPELLDQVNQDDQWELTPTLSPDGRYFYYEKNGEIICQQLNGIL